MWHVYIHTNVLKQNVHSFVCWFLSATGHVVMLQIQSIYMYRCLPLAFTKMNINYFSQSLPTVYNYISSVIHGA